MRFLLKIVYTLQEDKRGRKFARNLKHRINFNKYAAENCLFSTRNESN